MTFDGIYRGARVLITGHTGFKGSWLTSWLLSKGAVVCGYSKDVPTSPSLFQLAELRERIEHRTGDTRDKEYLSETIQSFKPNFIFHLAAQAIVSASYIDPIETITSNVLGTANLMESLRAVDWPCVAIIITSDKCYDNVEWVWGYRETDALGGKDIYSGSKGAAELVFKSYFNSFFKGSKCTVRFAVTRAGNVIGGGDWAADRIVADCMRAWKAGNQVQIRSPTATRPWQHVLEPLSGYLCVAAQLARDSKFNGEPYNFGPRAEQNTTVLQVISELSAIWGFDSDRSAFSVVDNVPFYEAGLLKLNCDKALLELGWEANLTHSECIEMTGSWYRAVIRDGLSAASFTARQILQYEKLAKIRGRSWTLEET